MMVSSAINAMRNRVHHVEISVVTLCLLIALPRLVNGSDASCRGIDRFFQRCRDEMNAFMPQSDDTNPVDRLIDTKPIGQDEGQDEGPVLPPAQQMGPSSSPSPLSAMIFPLISEDLVVQDVAASDGGHDKETKARQDIPVKEIFEAQPLVRFGNDVDYKEMQSGLLRLDELGDSEYQAVPSPSPPPQFIDVRLIQIKDEDKEEEKGEEDHGNKRDNNEHTAEDKNEEEEEKTIRKLEIERRVLDSRETSDDDNPMHRLMEDVFQVDFSF